MTRRRGRRDIYFRVERGEGVVPEPSPQIEGPHIESPRVVTTPVETVVDCTVVTPCCRERVTLPWRAPQPGFNVVTWHGVRCPACERSYTFELRIDPKRC